MSKCFEFEGQQFKILHPSEEVFSATFFKAVYTAFYDRIEDGRLEPSVDVDQLVSSVTGVDLYKLALEDALKLDRLRRSSDILLNAIVHRYYPTVS